MFSECLGGAFGKAFADAFSLRPIYAEVNTGASVPAKPEVNAQGMNMDAFGGVNSGAVDLASGAFSFSRTDIHIPGRHGMDLDVGRTYNSKEFKASPKWSSLDGDAYYNYAGEDLSKIKWQAATPAQWAGWVGNGWKTNVSGRLLDITFNSYSRQNDWWGANLVYRDTLSTEIVVIQTANGNYSFEKEYKEDKDAVHYADAQFYSRDKGNKNRLEKTVAGFVLTFEDGKHMVFKENYYNKTFQIYYYSETDMRSVQSEYNVQNAVVGDYLSTVEDTHGNAIHYEYEKGAPILSSFTFFNLPI
jgi:hypothetical protein